MSAGEIKNLLASCFSLKENRSKTVSFRIIYFDKMKVLAKSCRGFKSIYKTADIRKFTITLRI
jgi:hypothetical protein